MTDNYNIDSHKLIYHPERVAEWLRYHSTWETAKKIYPIYVEITTIGACNHRCVFCSVDYLDYNNIGQNENVLKRTLTEMSELGIKSVMFAGEGEPTLWRPLPRVLDHCTFVGIDTSLTTNMVPFNEGNVESFVRNCKWIKTSINAGTSETYAKIHNTKEEDFDKVIENFKMSIEIRNANGYKCTIGGQMLLLPENANESVGLAVRLKDIGVDYLVIKPYTQSLYGISHRYENIKYSEYYRLEEELDKLETKTFKIIFRRRSMEKYSERTKANEKCYSTPFFWAYIMADGSLYSCSAFLGNETFYLGNINNSFFKEIWESEKRKECIEFIQNKLDLTICRKNCRMDEVNHYLWKLKNPDSHVNFI